MTLDWQNLAALSLVLAAVVYLVGRLWWRSRRVSSGGCGTCAGCSAAPSQGPQIVSIEPLEAKPQTDR